MIDLSENSLSTWLSKGPQDVRDFIADGNELVPGAYSALASSLSAATPGEIPDILRGDPDGVRAMGRVGRVRLMARVAAAGDEGAASIIRRIVGEDSEGGDATGGADRVGVLFLEDLREFASAVVGPRVAARMVDGPALSATAEAASTLESDMAFRQGGV